MGKLFSGTVATFAAGSLLFVLLTAGCLWISCRQQSEQQILGEIQQQIQQQIGCPQLTFGGK